MTVIMPFGRIVTRFTPRTSVVLTRLNSSTSSIYASCQCASDTTVKSRLGDSKFCRSFSSSVSARDDASAPKPVGRPKAHTGRAKASTTKKSTTKKSTASGEQPEKPVKKAKGRATAKSKTKPKKKIVKPKVKKVKPPSKNAVALAARKERLDLKAKALLDEPKKLPDNAYAVYFSEGAAAGIPRDRQAEVTRERAVRYRTLSPEEHERLNHIAVQNRKKYEATLQEWISQYTPLQIRQANEARQKISKRKLAANPTAKQKPRVHLIKDDRAVKGPRNAYALFSMDRWASGDFKNLTVSDSSKLIAKEWKELSPTEKREYTSRAENDMKRYAEQKIEAYGPPAVREPKRKYKPRAKKAETSPTLSA